MIVSLHKKLLPLKIGVGAVILSLYAAPVFAQDTESENETQAAQLETQQEAQAENRQDAQSATGAEAADRSVRRERYYLGERPRLKRQQGPALGKPKNIRPQPFVPKGSVIVPPAPVDTDLETAELDAAIVEGLQTDAEPVVTGSEADLSENADILNVDAVGTEPDMQAPDIQASDMQAEEQFLEVGALELLDPSGIGILPADSSYPRSFWNGRGRAEVAAGYNAYQNAAGSRALSYIARKIVLSGATLPEPEGDADILAIIQARLALLVSLGDYEGYISLLERLPAERDWSALVKDFTNKHLLKGELSDACAVAERQRAMDDDAYWLRLAAFCEAARGNRNGVDFQLGILEEVSEVQPTFYQLIDQIVVEASQAPGTVIPEAATLSNSLKVDLLEATMARLARAKVPLLALEGVNPLAVRMMLALPGVERAAKIDLMGLAIRRGWLDGESLAAFIRNHTLEAGEIEAALGALDDDGRFVIDAALARISSDADGGEMRTDALSKLWGRSISQRVASVASAGYTRVTADVIPNPDAGQAVAILARAALLSGDTALATNWFNALRAENAGEAAVDKDLIALAPLMAVAGTDGAPALTEAQLSLWWQGEAEREDHFERANLLFTVLEALGSDISDDCWLWLEGGPAVFAGGTPSAAMWRRFMIAVANKDIPQALAQSFALMSDRGPAAVPAALAGSLIGGLMDLGLEAEARLIATEMLVGQGL